MLVTNCDTGCCACMACEVEGSGKVDFYRDVMLKEYFKKNKAHDAQFKNVIIRPVDESTVVSKIQAGLEKDDARRFFPNDFWSVSIRRALYRADIPVAKSTIKLASSVHGFKPYISGLDYLEFGLLDNVDITASIDAINVEMPVGLKLKYFRPVLRDANLMKRGGDYLAHYHYVLDVDEDEARHRLRILADNPQAIMKVKRDEYRKGLTTVEMSVHEWLKDVWLIRNGHELVLSMMMAYGEPTPYNVISSVFGMNLAEAHSTACRLRGVFPLADNIIDFFTPVCVSCGAVISQDIAGMSFNPDYCVKCADKAEGRLILATGSEIPTVEV